MAPVIVVTGPSGVGKGTLIARLRERIPELALSVSVTTRSPRRGEEQGVAYHFIDDAGFDQHLEANDFVEHATYAGNRYGTLRRELERGDGRPVVLEIELQGARQIRQQMPAALQIFVAPPSAETLRERLAERGTDTESQIADRLATAREELAARDEFATTVVNDDLDTAVDELERIVRQQLH